MNANWRIVQPGEETDRAVVAARLDFEERHLNRFGYLPEERVRDLWWPIGGGSPWNGSTSA
jgi:hypothetical protein